MDRKAWEVLQICGVRARLLAAVKAVYENSKARVRVTGERNERI